MEGKETWERLGKNNIKGICLIPLIFQVSFLIMFILVWAVTTKY